MALNSPAPLTVVNIPLFSGAAPVWGRRLTGVMPGQPLVAFPAGSSTLLGVNHPGTQNSARVLRFRLDGTTTAFTLPTAATGVTYPTTNAASLTAANYLETIALTFAPQYQVNATVLRRVGSDASPSAGQFKINGTTVTLGAAGTAGQIVEILVPDPATIRSIFGGTVASPTAGSSGVPLAVTTNDFMTAGVAAVNLIKALTI